MISKRDSNSDMEALPARMALGGLLAIIAFVGYEWFVSGLTKIVRGGFPSGLSDELQEKSEGTVAWYKSFLDGTVIPNGRTFGVLIELGELAIGAALIAAAGLWLLRWDRLGYRSRMALLASIALASLGAILMAVNFHLANGAPHPWLIPKDGFDEGVDLDSMLPLIQLVVLVFSTALLLALRRDHAAAAGESAGSDAPTPSVPTSLAA